MRSAPSLPRARRILPERRRLKGSLLGARRNGANRNEAAPSFSTSRHPPATLRHPCPFCAKPSQSCVVSFQLAANRNDPASSRSNVAANRNDPASSRSPLRQIGTNLRPPDPPCRSFRFNPRQTGTNPRRFVPTCARSERSCRLSLPFAPNQNEPAPSRSHPAPSRSDSPQIRTILRHPAPPCARPERSCAAQREMPVRFVPTCARSERSCIVSLSFAPKRSPLRQTADPPDPRRATPTEPPSRCTQPAPCACCARRCWRRRTTPPCP